MNEDTLLDLRKVTGTAAFGAQRRLLEGLPVMTKSLENIIVEVEKIQNQIAEVADTDKPWSETNRGRVKGLAIVGNAGTGKTWAAEVAIKLLGPVRVGPATDYDGKVLSVVAPSTGSAGEMAKNIIVGTGLPIVTVPKVKDAPGKILNRMHLAKYTLLFLDEASRCASPAILTSSEIRKQSGLMWTILMSLLDSTTWSTPVVLTGLPCLIDSLYLPETDDRIKRVRGEASRRFHKIRIPDARIDTEGGAIEGVIARYCQMLGVESLLDQSDEIGPRLIHASNYAFGTALVMAQWAVALAKTRAGKKGKLKREDFAAIYHFMAGGAMDANIFAVSDWFSINPEILMPQCFEDARYKEISDGE